jgi:hypothetical protein
MHIHDVMILCVLGVLLWVGGTVYFASQAPVLLSKRTLSILIFILAPVLSAAAVFVILYWRGIAPSSWAAAALLLAIPGMLGEALVLGRLALFVPRLPTTAAGPYGALLFLTYALVLAVAELVTLSSARLP